MTQRTREEKLVSLQNISSLGPAAAVFSAFLVLVSVLLDPSRM